MIPKRDTHMKITVKEIKVMISRDSGHTWDTDRDL